MNIACPSCPAKYGVPDEKVRGRKVRITCKRCGAAIIVDGTQAAAADAPAPAPDSNGGRERHRTMLGGLEAPADSAPGAPQSQPPPAPAAAAAPVAIPKPAAGFPRPGAGAPAGGPLAAAAAAKPGGIALPKVQAKAGAVAAKAGSVATPKADTKPKTEPPWTVAVTDDDHRDMSLAQVVDAYAAKTIDAETYIWRDGMDDWLTPFEIPEIKAALEARSLTPRENEGSESAAAAPVGGAWREPGKWDPGADAGSFDDVTVAMAAPRAQELLDAFAQAEAGNVAAPIAGKPARLGPRLAAGAAPEATPSAEKVEESPKFTAIASEPSAVTLPEAASPPAPVVAAPPEPEAAAAPPAEKKDLFARAPGKDLFARAPEKDLFARAPEVEDAPRSRMPSIPPDAGGQGSLTGARNESSVLFSLDQLTGAGPKEKKKAEPRIEKVSADAFLFGGASKSDDETAPPSVANLGGGALFTAPTMAAPDFTAAVVPSAPSHPPPSAPSAAAPAAKKPGGMPWIAMVVVALVGGGGAAFALLKPKAAPAPEATPQVVTAPPPATAAPTPIPTAAPEPAAAPAIPPAASAGAAAPAPAAGTPAAPVAATGAAPAAIPPGGAQAAAPAAPAAAPGTQPKPGAPAAAAPKPAEPPAPAAAEGPEFDKAAASAALNAAVAAAQGECAAQDGPHGTGKVTITFVNSGRATNALVSGDFAGSALGGCVARIFRGVKVPAFAGDSVRVNKSVHIP